MALLNPPELLPSIARYIYRYLLSRSKLTDTRANLIGALAPPTLLHPTEPHADPGSLEVEKTVGLCQQLGLVAADGDNITLSPDLPAEARNPKKADAGFITLLRQLVLHPDQNTADWGSQEGTRDFTNAIAWYLMQDPTNFPGTWDAHKGRHGAATSQGNDFGPGAKWPIVNDQRWRPFARWSGYLGFTWSHSLGGTSAVVPDPTEAIRAHLPALLEAGGELRAADFRDRLAQELPVVDGGTYRRFVQEQLPQGPDRDPDLLSASLSFALLRLEDEDQLQLFDRADTDKVRLDAAVAESRVISHIARPKAATKGKNAP